MSDPALSLSALQTTFYTRSGEVIIPPPGAIVRPREGIFAFARAGDAALFIWPNYTKGIADLPGGGIDPGETLDQAMEREWIEETGIAFAPLSGLQKEFRHTRGFFAEKSGEYWIYSQIFRLYDYAMPVETGVKWRNPEGDQASWEKLSDLGTLPLNQAHWLGIIEFMPELGR